MSKNYTESEKQIKSKIKEMIFSGINQSAPHTDPFNEQKSDLRKENQLGKEKFMEEGTMIM